MLKCTFRKIISQIRVFYSVWSKIQGNSGGRGATSTQTAIKDKYAVC